MRSSIGADPADSADLRFRKRLLVGVALLILPVGFTWGLLYWLVGETGGRAHAVGLRRRLDRQPRRLRPERGTSPSCGPPSSSSSSIAPALGLIMLGGLEESSSVILWSLLAPLGAVAFDRPERAWPWFGAFVATIALSLVLAEVVRPDGADLPERVRPDVRRPQHRRRLVRRDAAARDLRARARRGAGARRGASSSTSFPEEVAQRLQADPSTIADHFDDASILFADVVDFTPLSSRLDAREVVGLLDRLFTSFDELVDRYEVEKIKTIGDCYMVAAGVPRHAARSRAGARAVSRSRCASARKTCLPDRGDLRLRIGISSGPVVAGVIGRRRFLYDLWGDTVNMASRMESHGTPDDDPDHALDLGAPRGRLRHRAARARRREGEGRGRDVDRSSARNGSGGLASPTMSANVEAFDAWIRSTFVELNTALEDLYFAQERSLERRRRRRRPQAADPRGGQGVRPRARRGGQHRRGVRPGVRRPRRPRPVHGRRSGATSSRTPRASSGRPTRRRRRSGCTSARPSAWCRGSRRVTSRRTTSRATAARRASRRCPTSSSSSTTTRAGSSRTSAQRTRCRGSRRSASRTRSRRRSSTTRTTRSRTSAASTTCSSRSSTSTASSSACGRTTSRTASGARSIAARTPATSPASTRSTSCSGCAAGTTRTTRSSSSRRCCSCAPTDQESLRDCLRRRSFLDQFLDALDDERRRGVVPAQRGRVPARLRAARPRRRAAPRPARRAIHRAAVERARREPPRADHRQRPAAAGAARIARGAARPATRGAARRHRHAPRRRRAPARPRRSRGELNRLRT